MMAQQNKDLPEGTDTIIPGAMETETAAKRGRSGSTRSTQSSSTGGTALMDKLRSEGGKLSDQAGGKARDFLGQGLERSSEALGNVSRLIGDTAEGLDDKLGKEYGDYARKAAETIDRTAKNLRNKDPDELIDDTRDFVRKSPGVALAGAAIVGFALARLVKSGLSATSDDEGGSSNSGNKSSRRS